MNHHQLIVEARIRSEMLFVCPEPGCGRRLVVSRTGLTVLDQGDFYALHSGSTGELAMGSSSLVE